MTVTARSVIITLHQEANHVDQGRCRHCGAGVTGKRTEYAAVATRLISLSLSSVEHTGPFNAHFVRDIGVAYLAAALGVGLAAWRTDWLMPAGSVALVFLGVHAGLHVIEWSHGHQAALHAGRVDHVGIYLPPLLLSFWMFFANRKKSHV